MRNMTGKVMAAALTCALAAAPLAGCAGDNTKSDATVPSDAQVVTSEPTGGEDVAEAGGDGTLYEPKDTTKVDFSKWKTLADAFADTDDFSSSYNYDETELVAAFDVAGGHVIVHAKMTPEVYAAAEKMLDDGTEITIDKNPLKDELGKLAIDDVKDITKEKLSADDMEKLVGKTVKELTDDGFVFGGYVMYGDETTCASFDKGNFTYEMNFEKKLTEENMKDGADALGDAKVVSVEPDAFVSSEALTLASERAQDGEEGQVEGGDVADAEVLVVDGGDATTK